MKDAGEVAALYYPYMRPPRRWLARTLLYVDVAGSIIQPGDEEQVFPKLQRSGAFRPCTVSSLLAGESDTVNLVQEVVDRVGSHPLPPAEQPDLLLPHKLPPHISQGLVDAGLFAPHPEGFSATTPSAMPNLLSVVADRVTPQLSVQHGLLWRPATDTRDAFESLGTSFDAGAAVVLALPGLPQPRFTTDDDLQRVVEFRDQHRDALLAYRTQLDSIVNRIADDAESATDAVDALTEELAEHARQISAIRDLPSFREMGSDLIVSVGLGAGAGAIAGELPGAAIGGGGAALRTLWANRVKVRAAVVGRKTRREAAHLNYLVGATEAGILK